MERKDSKKDELLKKGYINTAMLGAKFGRKQLRPSELPKELLEKALHNSIRYRGGIYFDKDGSNIISEYLKLSPSEKISFISKIRYGENWFTNNNIKYERQYKYINCRGKKKELPFDFYLNDYDLLIEIQGEQHTKSKEYFGGDIELENRKKLDKIKRDFATKYHNFLEIQYYEDEIKVLSEYLKIK